MYSKFIIHIKVVINEPHIFHFQNLITMEIPGNTCFCNATGSIRHLYGLQIDNVQWKAMPNGYLNEWTCRGRRGREPHLISCLPDGVESGATAIEMILGCLCLILLLITLLSLHKLWKKKKENEINVIILDHSKAESATKDTHM